MENGPLCLDDILLSRLLHEYISSYNRFIFIKSYSSFKSVSILHLTDLPGQPVHLVPHTLNMKTFIILAACVVACVALPQGMMQSAVRKPPVPIVKLGFENDNQGQYNLQFQSGDGTRQQEQGNLKNLGDKEGPVQVKSGSYSYIGSDEKTYTVTWSADERGFLAQGEHLPTPPPVPAEILRSLQG